MPTSRAKDLFLDAVELPSRAARVAYLDRACADDPALRRRVEALLTAHERPEPLLDRAALAAWDLAPDEPAFDGPRPGDAIGPYILREAIGTGGMGLVYRAEQLAPVRREVALKVVRPGMDTRRVIARFEAERRALALMDHPHIARVLDAGASAQGRPYFVMELVRGVPLTEYCDTHRLPIRRRLELLVSVCRAVQHAHQKGVIHRDLKPSNVLVTLVDGLPVPKVIDFGVAKAIGAEAPAELFPGAGGLVGTPLYMSPEQAEPYGVDVDTRTDIYSLGVLLYELLTGTTPFGPVGDAATTADEVRRRLRVEEPTPPSRRLESLGPALAEVAARRAADPRRLIAAVRGDLDAIALKALARDRRGRYESASGLAADLTRHLAVEPVVARADSAPYRLGKLARRNCTTFAVAGAVTLALLAGLLVAGWQAMSARVARDLAERHAQELQRRDEHARHARYAASIRRAARLLGNGQTRGASDLLDALAPARAAAPGTIPADDLRGFEWTYLRGLIHDECASWIGHDGKDVYHIEYSPDGRTLATCGADGTARVWNAADHRLLAVLKGHEGEVNWVAYAPDGRTLATAGDDGTVRLWSAAGAEVAQLPNDTDPMVAVAFLPDGRGLVTASRQARIRRWDLGSDGSSLRAEHHLHRKLEAVALSPVGPTLAVAGEDFLMHLMDLSGGGLRPLTLPVARHDGSPGALMPPTHHTLALAFSRDGRTLAIGGNHGVHAVLYREPSWSRVDALQGPSARTYGVAFAPNGRTLATVDDHGVVRFWDIDHHEIRASLHGHTRRAWGLAFAPDGRTLATSGADGAIKLWHPAASAPGRTVLVARRPAGAPAPSPVGSVAFAEGGKAVVAADGSGYVARWHLGSKQVEWRPPTAGRPVVAALVAPGGQSLLTKRTADRPADPSTFLLEDLAGRRAAATLPSGTALTRIAAFDDAGTLLAVADPSGDLVVRSVDGERPPVHLRAQVGPGSSNPVFFAGGTRLLAICGDNQHGRESFRIGVWDTTDGHPVGVVPLAWTFRTVAVTPDGRTLAVPGSDNDVVLVDPATGDIRGTLLGHDDAITALAFAPDGRTLATASRDNTVRLWSVAGAEELLTLQGHRGPVTALAFAPAGDRLVSVAHRSDGAVEAIIWHGSAREKIGNR